MNKILVIVAACLSLGAAYFSFDTATKKKILTIERNELESKLGETTAQLNKTKSELEQMTKAKESTEQMLASTQTELSSTKSQLASAKSEADAAKGALDSEKQKAEDAEKQLADYKNQFGGREPGAVVAELEEAQKKLAEAQIEIGNKEKLVVSTQEQVAKFQKEDDQRRRGIAPPGVSGRIMAINSEWGFAVLDVGRDRGVLENAELTVVRGSQPVAKLKIAMSDASSAVADFVQVFPNMTPSVGDTVISN